ncbi:MAG: T9SS type A sorting domain-containing protein [Chlorobi bacterium]|nr:T9SS type A sorting domain-containing protein [Chlorobiota bacterium]
MPIDDYVCIVITSIDNPLAGEVTSLYPNPARELVNITSSQTMSHITIVNYVGQVVYDADITDQTKVTLNTGSYDAGVYVVRISTDNGIVTKRMTITK